MDMQKIHDKIKTLSGNEYEFRSFTGECGIYTFGKGEENIELTVDRVCISSTSCGDEMEPMRFAPLISWWDFKEYSFWRDFWTNVVGLENFRFICPTIKNIMKDVNRKFSTNIDLDFFDKEKLIAKYSLPHSSLWEHQYDLIVNNSKIYCLRAICTALDRSKGNDKFIGKLRIERTRKNVHLTAPFDDSYGGLEFSASPYSIKWWNENYESALPVLAKIDVGIIEQEILARKEKHIIEIENAKIKYKDYLEKREAATKK